MMYDPWDRRPVYHGRPYPIRTERLVGACLAAVGLIALGAAAVVEISHWVNSDAGPAWLGGVAFFGYPALLAGGIAGVHTWLSGERDLGRIGRGVGFGLAAGLAVLALFLLIAMSSIQPI